MKKKIIVKLLKSPYGLKPRQKDNIKGLGLRTIGDTSELIDNPCTRGMIKKVINFVSIS